MKLNIQLFASSKSTNIYEYNVNNSNNTSSLQIDIYFSANNGSTFFTNRTLYCSCNGITQSRTVSHSQGGSVSATFYFENIVHNSDGSKNVDWNWSCATGTSGLGTIADSGNYTMSKIPRQSQIDPWAIDNSERPIENSYLVKINKYVSYYYNVLKVGFIDNQLLINRYDVNGDYTFQLTENELNNIMYPLMSNVSKKMVVMHLYTYTDSSMTTLVGESDNSIWYWGTIIDANPIFNNFVYEDTNEKTLALTGDNQAIIKGYSNLKTTVSTSNKAIGKKGATISKYRLVVGEKQVDANYNDIADVELNLNSIDSNVFTMYAIDSRGNSTMKQLSPSNYLPYFAPTLKPIVVNREDAIGTNTILSFNGTFYNANFGQVDNDITASYTYQRTDLSEEWTDIVSNFYVLSDDATTIRIADVNNKTFADYFKVGDKIRIKQTLTDLTEYTVVSLSNENSYLTISGTLDVEDPIDTIKYNALVHTGITPLTITKNDNNYSFEGEIAGSEGATGFNIQNSYLIKVVIKDKLSSNSDNETLTSGTPNQASSTKGEAFFSPVDEEIEEYSLQFRGKSFVREVDSINKLENVEIDNETATLLGSKIIDSGSNANGNWIKYADGTMICLKNIKGATPCTTPFGSMFETGGIDLGTFPSTFTIKPYVFVNSNSSNAVFIETIYNTTTTVAGGVWLCRPTSVADLHYDLVIFAIGKWK